MQGTLVYLELAFYDVRSLSSFLSVFSVSGTDKKGIL